MALRNRVPRQRVSIKKKVKERGGKESGQDQKQSEPLSRVALEDKVGLDLVVSGLAGMSTIIEHEHLGRGRLSGDQRGILRHDARSDEREE